MSTKEPHTLEHHISLLLRIGITASGLLIAVGLVLLFVQGSWDAEPPSMNGWLLLQHMFAAPLDELLISPQFYLYSGILLLMATPIVRVLFTIYGFAREKDWRYTVISSVVLAVIFISIAFSIVH